MGSLTVTWRARRAPPQKSRVVGLGAPGARGSPAAGRAGPGCRPGAASAPRPGSRCCGSALAPSSRPRPASRPPAQVRGLGTGEGSAADGAGRTGAREATGPPPPAHGAPASQWTANGLPGRPGPHALSRARAPWPGSGNAARPRTGAGPAPCCPGAPTAPARPVSAMEEGTAGGVQRGCWQAACACRGPPSRPPVPLSLRALPSGQLPQCHLLWRAGVLALRPLPFDLR